MNAKELLAIISENIIKSLKIKLEAGETCPCCGHKKRAKMKATQAMLEANRINVQKAIKARKAKANGKTLPN